MDITQLSPGDRILYPFSRPAVQARDLSRFLDAFGLEHLPTGQPLRALYNRFGFLVSGYQDDPRELYEIPEVRAFYQSFRGAWPFWFFACDLALPCLHAMTLCCLPSLQIRRRDGAFGTCVNRPREDLARFVLESFPGLNLLFARAGMNEAENRDRSQQIFDYYSRGEWVGAHPMRGMRIGGAAYAPPPSQTGQALLRHPAFQSVALGWTGLGTRLRAIG